MNKIQIEENEFTKRCADRLFLFGSFKRNFGYLTLGFLFCAVCELLVPQIMDVKYWYVPFFFGCLLFYIIKRFDLKRIAVKLEIFFHLLLALVCFALFTLNGVIWNRLVIMSAIMLFLYIVSGQLAKKAEREFENYIKIEYLDE